ncbi:hypothetical protein JCM8547_002306 [Rhodosporidiobolus lusitaniae]
MRSAVKPKAVSETDDLELAALMDRVARENKEVSGDEDSEGETRKHAQRVRLKAAGNAAFAAKKYLKASKEYSKAIELEKDDVASAALLSNRSASYLQRTSLTRLSRTRTLPFSASRLGQGLAIRYAEDDASKARYEASLKTTEEAGRKSVRANTSTGDRALHVGKPEDSFQSRLEHAMINEGYYLDPFGGLVLSCSAANICKDGMRMLDESAIKVMHLNGMIEGHPSSVAVPNIAECILIDEHAFMMPYGNEPSCPLAKKFNSITIFEIMMHGGQKYLTHSIWSAKDIVEDLDKRIKTDGVRRLASQLIRCQIITASAQGLKGETGAAVTSMKLALGIQEEGAKKWAHIPYDQKRVAFKPTLARVCRTYLLNCLLRSSRDAKTPSAKRTFPLESVEKLAKEIIAENDTSKWPSFAPGQNDRLAYHVKPNWEAYSALGFVALNRMNNASFIKPPVGKLIWAEEDLARQASEHYEAAAAPMPKDWRDRPQVLFYALETRLRQGEF